MSEYCKIHIAENAGHHVYLDNPVFCGREVCKFLTKDLSKLPNPRDNSPDTRPENQIDLHSYTASDDLNMRKIDYNAPRLTFLTVNYHSDGGTSAKN